MGQRPDGYHLMDMLMQSVTLHDTLHIRPAKELSLEIQSGLPLSAGEDNLVLRAARALQTAFHVVSGAQITLVKRIPMGAGLGGGSADAAAALKGLAKLWKIGCDLEKLCEIGAKLGADIPFCLHDAPRRARGIGEILSPIAVGRAFPLILIQPCAALSTKEVFTAYHQQEGLRRPDTEKAMQALKMGDLAALKAAGGNVLESASIPMRPEIAAARNALYAADAAFAQMTGSGSVVFGAFETEEAAKEAYAWLQNSYPVCILTETALT